MKGGQWLVLGAVAAVAAAGWLALGVLAPKTTPSIAPGSDALPTPRPAIGLTGADIVLRREGLPQARLSAERIEVAADGKSVTFSGSPKAVIHTNGVPTLTVTGGRIVLDRQSQNVRVEGGVRITTASGESITAKSAHWDHQTQALELTGGAEATFNVQRFGR